MNSWSLCPGCHKRHTELHPDTRVCWPCQIEREQAERVDQARVDGLAGVAAFERWLAGERGAA